MTEPLDIDYLIGQIDKLDEWLKALPTTAEYRNNTTIGEFRQLRKAKEMELGLTPQVVAQLHQIKDNEDLDWAWTGVAMTMDHQGLMHSPYFDDLPLNYYWMPEYQPLLKVVDDFMDTRPKFQNGEEEDEVLRGVVRKHLAEFPIARK